MAFMVFWRLLLLLISLSLELLLLLKHLLRLLHLLLLEQMLIDQLPRQLLRAIHHHVAVVFDGRWRKYLDILLEILQRLARLSDHVSVHEAQQLQNEEVLVDQFLDSGIVLANLHDLQFVVGVTEHVVFGLDLEPVEYALHDALIGLHILLGQLLYETVGFLSLCVEHLHLLRTELRDGTALLGCLLLRIEYALEVVNPLFRLDEFGKDLAHLF